MCLDTVVISMLVFDAWFFRPNFTRGPEIVHFTGYRTPLDDAYKVIVERLKRIAAPPVYKLPPYCFGWGVRVVSGVGRSYRPLFIIYCPLILQPSPLISLYWPLVTVFTVIIGYIVHSNGDRLRVGVLCGACDSCHQRSCHQLHVKRSRQRTSLT